MTADLQRTIDDAWEARDTLSANTKGAVRDAVEHALGELDAGRARVAAKAGDEWVVHQWLKKAVLLSFRLTDNAIIADGPGPPPGYPSSLSRYYLQCRQPLLAGIPAALFRPVAGVSARPASVWLPRGSGSCQAAVGVLDGTGTGGGR